MNVQVRLFILFFKDLFIYLFDGEEGQRERKRETQAASALSMDPDVGLGLTTLGS